MISASERDDGEGMEDEAQTERCRKKAAAMKKHRDAAKVRECKKRA